MTLPEKLDRAVHAARLDILTPHGAPARRNLRWLPLAILLALPISYAVFAGTMRALPSRNAPELVWLAFGAALVFALAYGAAWLVRLFGPRLGTADGPLDERERAIGARAFALSGTMLGTLAALFCFYAAVAALFGGWRPESAAEWVYLGLTVQAWSLTLPVLVASWLQPAPVDDED